MASRLRVLVALISDLSHLDVTARVAKTLLAQHRNAGKASFTVNQSELAAMTGTSREVAARGLKRLEEAGAIARRRSVVEVVDPEVLERAADGKL
jgi:CRP/FNR family transcriptional regulator